MNWKKWICAITRKHKLTNNTHSCVRCDYVHYSVRENTIEEKKGA